MSFADHFSAQSSTYAAFRPRYPDALFDWLATLVRPEAVAWDCATGNGQAAVALAGRIAHVVATDASAAQIAHAEAHRRVTYAVAPAEASGLADSSVDLVTVGGLGVKTVDADFQPTQGFLQRFLETAPHRHHFAH